MTRHLRRTLRSFLRTERPATPEVAREVLDEWFGRYSPDPGMLDQVIERHFAETPPSRKSRMVPSAPGKDSLRTEVARIRGFDPENEFTHSR